MVPAAWDPGLPDSTKYARKHKSVEIIGLDDASAERHRRLTGELSSH